MPYQQQQQQQQQPSPMPHRQQPGPSAFSTRYYDSSGDAEVFPQPTSSFQREPGSRTLYLSAGANDHHNYNNYNGYNGYNGNNQWGVNNFQTAASEAPTDGAGEDPHQTSGRCCNLSVWRWWLGILAMSILAVVTLCIALEILFSEEFQNFSALAREGWLARLPTLLIALAACALVTALLGTCLGCRESKLLLRTFSVVAALLGCLLLGLALSAWLYSLQARPLVFQAANLICQEERAWHCKAAAAGTTEGATEGAAEGAA